MRSGRSSDSMLIVALLGCLVVPLGLILLGGAGAAFWLLTARVAPGPMVSSPPTTGPQPPVVPPQAPVLPSPPPPMPPSVEPPRIVRATVTAVEGSVGVDIGATCGFSVERRDRPDGTFWCNAQIVCGGRLLYGGPDAGYFPCTLHQQPRRDVEGSDPQTRSQDTDGAMSIDTRSGSLEIWDDETSALGRFRVVAQVESVE